MSPRVVIDDIMFDPFSNLAFTDRFRATATGTGAPVTARTTSTTCLLENPLPLPRL
jgi:hypothetical protein